MLTTVTLEPDVEAYIGRSMRERGLTFKQALSDAVRSGMGQRADGEQADLPTHDMGEPLVDITKALRLAGELEDQELAGRVARSS